MPMNLDAVKAQTKVVSQKSANVRRAQAALEKAQNEYEQATTDLQIVVNGGVITVATDNESEDINE